MLFHSLKGSINQGLLALLLLFVTVFRVFFLKMRSDTKKIVCFIIIIMGLLIVPRSAFSQKIWSEQSKMLSQLRKSKADTARVQLLLKLGNYYMLREYYVYKTGNPKAQLDTAIMFGKNALQLSQSLKFDSGKNEAILLMGDAHIRKNEVDSALNSLATLQGETRFRLLIILSRHYLFHSSRSKLNLDKALFFLAQAKKSAPIRLAAKWEPERIHIEAMAAFITKGLQQSITLYQQTIDKIASAGNEERKALLWYELATLIPLRKKTGITRLYCHENMRSIYKKNGNQEREAWVLKTIADINMVNGELALAEKQYLESLGLYKAIGYRDLHYIYELLAVTSRNKGDFRKSNFYGLKAIENMRATTDSLTDLTFYGRLAGMYRQSGQPDKSAEWYSKTFHNRLFKEDSSLYKFREAGLYVRQLIKIKREKEALAYILKINAENKPIGIHSRASLVGSLAYCYHAVKQDRAAEKNYLELIALSGQLQQDNEIASDAYYEIGQYFIEKRQYGKALTYLQKVQHTSTGVSPLSPTKDTYLMLFRADSGLGNYTFAIQHLLRHKQLNDSIFNETKNWQIQELQIQFETATKDNDIQLLNSQNQLERMKASSANRAKNITLGGLALLLIIIGLLFNSYRIKQRNNRMLEVNQKELDQKNTYLKRLNSEQEKLLKEKEWLIKEVHHRVKNNLQMVTSLLYSQLIYLEDGAARLAVQDSLRRMQAMSLIHHKLYQEENTSTIAMPEYINDLVMYLNESFDTANRITFKQAIEPLYLDVAQAIPLGLIITESIVNAIKYAFGKEQKGAVSITLFNDGDGSLLLKISDNGIGLPVGIETEHHSLGLDLMRGLAKQLKGRFDIENDQGVHITVKFEIKKTSVSDAFSES